MVFLDVGVGDGAAIGVGVDQQDLAARGGRLEGEVVTATVVRPGAPLGPQTAARTRRASPSAGIGTWSGGGGSSASPGSPASAALARSVW
jgi:hypothetical protein